MSYFDEHGKNYTGPTAHSDEARESALRKHQAAMRQHRQRDHASMGDNQHHRAYINKRSDEGLYGKGLLRHDEVHPDADLTEDFKLKRIARECLSLDGSIPPPVDQGWECIRNASAGSPTFNDLLNNLADKSMIIGYQQANMRETWPAPCEHSTDERFSTLRCESWRSHPDPARGSRERRIEGGTGRR